MIQGGKMDHSARPDHHVFRGKGSSEDLGIRLGDDRKISHRDDPERYIAEEGLADAVNVALTLNMPLLLTGDPGTGKTQLADRIAFELGLGEVLKFETKSNTESRDLFYEVDMVGRLAAAQTREDTDPRRFITYNALGKAFLLAHTLNKVEDLLPQREGEATFAHDGPRQSVVLIDEIDKASRDFPNDLLNEIEGNYFRLRELRNAKVEAPRELLPIVVITSNSEKQLPDPFLRRCVYYHIKFPEREALINIVSSRLGDVFDGGSLLDEAVDFFVFLRRRLQRQPTTAELLRWIEVLHANEVDTRRGLREQKDSCHATTSVLCKNPEDQTAIARALDEWAGSIGPH